MRRKIVGVHRAAAVLLVLVWFTAGSVGLFLGFAREAWLLAALSVCAIAYAAIWLRVVATRRLLSWREVLFPWDDA